MNSMTRAALQTMLREIGLLSTIKLGWYIAGNTLMTDPFKSIGKSKDQADKLSRRQLKPAIFVYRYFLKKYESQEALALTKKVVQASGRAFLNTVLHDLDIPTLIHSTQREEIVRDRLRQVPNVTFSLKFEEEALHFTVSACRFVQLCHAIHHPELAPLFCSVDDVFFGHDLKGVSLQRATTIAQGGHTCPFIFSIEDDTSKYTSES